MQKHKQVILFLITLCLAVGSVSAITPIGVTIQSIENESSTTVELRLVNTTNSDLNLNVSPSFQLLSADMWVEHPEEFWAPFGTETSLTYNASSCPSGPNGELQQKEPWPLLKLGPKESRNLNGRNQLISGNPTNGFSIGTKIS